MSLTVEQLQDLRRVLGELPENEAKKVTKRDAVAALAGELATAQRRPMTTGRPGSPKMAASGAMKPPSPISTVSCRRRDPCTSSCQASAQRRCWGLRVK